LKKNKSKSKLKKNKGHLKMSSLKLQKKNSKNPRMTFSPIHNHKFLLTRLNSLKLKAKILLKGAKENHAKRQRSNLRLKQLPLKLRRKLRKKLTRKLESLEDEVGRLRLHIKI